mgnify:CR=1 FL=1
MDILQNELFLQSDFNILFKNNVEYFNDFVILSRKMNKTTSTSTSTLFDNKIINKTLYFKIKIGKHYLSKSKSKIFKKLTRSVNCIFIEINKNEFPILKDNTKLFYNLTNNTHELNIYNTCNIIFKYNYLPSCLKSMALTSSNKSTTKLKNKNVTFPNSIESLHYDFQENFILPYNTKFLDCKDIFLLKNRTHNLKFLNTKSHKINYNYKSPEKYAFYNLQILCFNNFLNRYYRNSNVNNTNNIYYDPKTLVTNQLCNNCITNRTKNIINLGESPGSNINLPAKMNSLCLISTDYRNTSFNIKLINRTQVNFIELIKYEFQSSYLDKIQKYAKIVSVPQNGVYFIVRDQKKYSNIEYDSTHFNRNTITSNIPLFKKNISEYIDK